MDFVMDRIGPSERTCKDNNLSSHPPPGSLCDVVYNVHDIVSKVYCTEGLCSY
jgi:hypothetical protein